MVIDNLNTFKETIEKIEKCNQIFIILIINKYYHLN